MSIRALPMIVLPFILYNVIVLFGGSKPADEVLNAPIFALKMMHGANWVFRFSDLIILFTMLMLFVELLKSTYTSSAAMLDHGLSMLVFIACLIEFLLVPKALTSTFFFILIATLIDVVAGYTIGIRTARRDLSIGSD
jgi:hypothetical protein